LQQADQGRDFPNFFLYHAHQFGQHRIDPVEVGLQARKPVARSRLRCGNAEIEIDVRVDANQQLLHHDWIPARRGVKRHLPAQRRLLPSAELFKRLEITIGEVHVQPFHARAILEPSAGDAVFHGARHAAIQRGEVAQPALLFPRPVNDSVKSADYLIDCLCWHGQIIT